MILAITSTTASIWTAIGTGALALATFVSLFFARRSIRQNQEQIKLGQEQLKQTQREIELSRTEVEEAHRPVVVPVVLVAKPAAAAGVSRSGSRGRYTMPRKPSVVETGVLALPLQNIGSGPALRVEATIRQLEVGAPGGPQTPGTAAGIGVTEIVPLEVKFPNLVEVPDFELIITYDDVSGNGWLTVGRWNTDEGRYTDLAFNTQAKSRTG